MIIPVSSLGDRVDIALLDCWRRNQSAPAVRGDGGELTYGELHRRAVAVAEHLRSCGVGPGDRVAVAIPRSIDLVVALAGVMLSGGAHASIDTSDPADRVAYLLSDLDPTTVLTTRNFRSRLKTAGHGVSLIEDLSETESDKTAAFTPFDDLEEVPCTLIYTSGSTGRPKASLIPHRALMSRLQCLQRRIGLRSDDRVLYSTAASFDVSIAELYWPLVTGAQLVVPRHGMTRDPDYLAGIIEAEAITTVHFVPSLLELFLLGRDEGERYDGLRRVLAGGEVLNPGLVDRFYRRSTATVYNMYGPSECAIYSTMWECPRDSSMNGPIPLGHAFDRTEVLVLSEDGAPVPQGEAGELCVGGAGVGLGYHRRPRLTAERFVPHPFRSDERVYRSGDLARERAPGVFDYLGRLDRQVKIRGYRIELSEIENTALSVPGVCRTAVVATSHPVRLVAFIVPSADIEDADGILADVRSVCRRTLPAYMVPTAVVALSDLPLSPNGKIDFMALDERAIDAVSTVGGESSQTDGVEAQLALIWCEVLHVQSVGRDDNLFEIGGDSLAGVQITRRARAAFDMHLPIRLVFECPTLAEYGAVVVQARQTWQTTLDRGILGHVDRQHRDRGPASLQQEQIWLHEQLTDGSSPYDVSFKLELRGAVDIDALVRAIDGVIDRHAVLSSCVVDDGGAVGQRPGHTRPLPIVINLGVGPGGSERVAEELSAPFELASGPLSRFVIVVQDADTVVLHARMHHTVADGQSLQIILADIEALYHGREPAPVPFQYADYAAWQRQDGATPVIERTLAEVVDELRDAPTVLDLSVTAARPRRQTADRLAFIDEELGPRLSRAVDETARLSRTTSTSLLLAAFGIVAARHGNTEDVVVGLPVSDRGEFGADDVVGDFVSSVPVRLRPAADLTVARFVERCRSGIAASLERGWLDVPELLRRLRIRRSLERNPLYQIWFNHLSYHHRTLEFDGVSAELHIPVTGGAMFDLGLYVESSSKGYRLTLAYDDMLFDRAAAASWLRQVRHVLQQLTDGSVRHIRDIGMRPAASTLRAPPAGGVPDMLDGWLDTVRRTPDIPSLEDPSGGYDAASVHAAATTLADRLASAGVGAGDVVALHRQRDATLVVAALAVWLRGGALLVLDPDQPESRLRQMVMQARPSVFIEQPVSGRASLAPSNCLTLDLDHASVAGVVMTPRGDGSVSVVRPDGPAWVVFTSGTMGGVKGVATSRAALSAFLDWYGRDMGPRADDRVPLLAGLGHDPLLRDVLAPLAVGATILVPGLEDVRDPMRMLAWLRGSGASFAHLTPPQLRLLAAAASKHGPLSALTRVVSGSSRLIGQDQAALAALAPNATLVNAYGATETPQIAAAYRVDEVHDSRSSIPVGVGVAHNRVVVVDPAGHEAAAYQPGEIHVYSRLLPGRYLDGSTRGFEGGSGDPAGRHYRTGDRGYTTRQGDIVVTGRADRQLNVAGLRIEPVEVERVLRGHPAVCDAAVTVRDAAPDTLAAFIVLNPDAAASAVEEVSVHAAGNLPAVAVPGSITVLDRLPLTPNGKVDERALCEHQDGLAERLFGFDDVAEAIRAEWRAVLGSDSVGRDTNFFDMGASSLQVLRVRERLECRLGMELHLIDLFEHSSIDRLARHILDATTAERPQPGRGSQRGRATARLRRMAARSRVRGDEPLTKEHSP